MLSSHFLNNFSCKLGRQIAVLLLILWGLVLAAPVMAQQDSASPSSAPSAQSSNSQQPQEPAEAGGPECQVGPVAVPKKKEAPPPPPKPKASVAPGLGDYSIQVNVPEVTVPVTVTTKNGEFIPGLKKEDFRVLEDGAPQKVLNFSQSSDAPITAVLLVEFAANHYRFIYDMLNNAYGFAQSLKPNDWVAVISYDMHPEVQQDFTQNKQAVLAALNRLRIPGFGETNEFDALYDTLDRLDRVEGHKYIILISSGVDTFSKLNFDKILKKVKAAHDVTIFCISTGWLLREMIDPYISPGDVLPGTTDRLDYLQADNELKTFAQLTGGKFYQPRFQGQIPEVVSDISATLRNQYLLTYHSTNPRQDGSYRKIKVDLVNPDTGGPINLHVNGKAAKYNIVAREGYTAKHEVE
ncbi:MAG TPA: VWA domain-containing protein [Terriglobales bacterium]|nr:VWA domain-containing protein [Terriglobales bacterium]